MRAMDGHDLQRVAEGSQAQHDLAAQGYTPGYRYTRHGVRWVEMRSPRPTAGRPDYRTPNETEAE